MRSSDAHGSGDNDAFTYDPNTNRMTKYQFNVNTQSFIGNLTWNANGTLATQNLTDPFNATDTQNCSYSHDDLVRISSVNCGSAWSQTFNYDPFGNLTKSGTMSFQPTYSSATNRMTSLPGFTPSYDADGNVLNDGSHAYTWDAYGHYVTVDGSSVVYDALGRMVELSGGGSQKFYLPDGSQIIFQGQVARRAGLSLPGGARVNYDSSHGGLLDYAHPDALGSFRLFTTPTRAFSSSQAYGPFGEPYAVSSISPDQAFTGETSNFALDLYVFPVRQYSDEGRWTSPDPAGLSAVDPASPQSWNSYAYVMNTPMNMVDPLGLCGETMTVSVTMSGGKGSSTPTISSGPSCGMGWASGKPLPQIIQRDRGIAPGWGWHDFVSSFKSLSTLQIARQLNQCAAKNANDLYSRALGENKVVNAVAGNSFAALSQLILGPGRPEGATGVVVAGPQNQNLVNLAVQGTGQVVGNIPVLGGTSIAPVAGSEIMIGGQLRFATMIDRYTAVAVKDLPAFSQVMGGAADVLDGKLLFDGATYLSMEIACAVPAFQ